MDKDQIIEIAKDVKNKSNKDLVEARDTLLTEFENTKKLVIDLTRHLEAIEEYYNIINKEIEKRSQ
jgi:predicted RND superfamily exporter protein